MLPPVTILNTFSTGSPSLKTSEFSFLKNPGRATDSFYSLSSSVNLINYSHLIYEKSIRRTPNETTLLKTVFRQIYVQIIFISGTTRQF